MAESYYRSLGEGTFESTHHTQGAWNEDEQHMAPVAGLLVHCLEEADPRPGMRLARVSFEILGVIPQGVFDVTTKVIRAGRTIELLEAELNYDIITGKNTFAPFNGQEKFVLPADSYTTVESTRGERLIVLNRDLQENKVATDCVITGIRMYNNYSSGNLANELMLCGDLMVKKECGSIEQLVERFGSYDEVEEDDYLGTYTYTWNFGYPSDEVWLKIELYYNDWEDIHTIRYLEFNDLRSN